MLRRHINPLESPLYGLPQDLFPEVASHLTSETDLVNATHVSHHLRTALLSYPSLWSQLDFEHEMRARAFFERSGQTSLHVDMAMDITRTVGSLAELRQQSKRIATLKLRHWWAQKKFLSEPLPALKRLGIFSEHHYYDDGWDEEWDTVWAPVWGPMKQATSWSFPSLTTLIIHNLNPIPFYTPHLKCFMFRDQESDADIILNFLDNCPLLEYIDVSYVGGPRDKHDLVVSLPCLQTYTEIAFDGACPLTVLNALILPPFCSVTLRFRDYSKTTAAVGAALHCFENPDYLAEIKRVKLGTTQDDDGNEVAGTLELVNAKGTKVCSEIMVSEEEGYQKSLEGGKNHSHFSAHLNLLRNLDGQSVEILCIDGYWSRLVGRGMPVEFLKEALSFGNVKTLILSRSAVEPCLLALEEDPGASDNSQWFLSINNLIICPGPEHDSHHKVFLSLFSLVQKRKAVGFPFKSVSLFFHSGLEWQWNQVLELLRSGVEKLEVVTGDDVLDWDVDKYFLDGLEHQNNREVQWD